MLVLKCQLFMAFLNRILLQNYLIQLRDQLSAAFCILLRKLLFLSEWPAVLSYYLFNVSGSLAMLHVLSKPLQNLVLMLLPPWSDASVTTVACGIQSSFRASSGETIIPVQPCVLTALVSAECISIRQIDTYVN
ncbi:MAG: hypothetical protein EZS28_018059 [Streblomastix strix]|uniref:Uncharacterized protein n=1 Tax=Streblomastix strix TaxID=222440 RepID=A0A5J4VV80_9EUKA|nr:MAG: hypothetical protein EZS28_018059 [Streblomastix strix]